MSYPQPPSGSYKQPLIEGLKNIGRTIESTEIANGNMKLGLRATFTGGVKTFPELTNTFIEALQSLPLNNVNGYYAEALRNGSVVPVSSNGAYVYDANNAEAVAYVQSRLDAEKLKVGELYFTT